MEPQRGLNNVLANGEKKHWKIDLISGKSEYNEVKVMLQLY